ncbi:alpha-taxilin-like [Physella acuta]|uniref:alpha-taxilin-like n=1 Tax=Physella acuta TaxID=109671 RepID=UPI0027DC03E4|nr:alpha-taxilin-like [Physella acuta]
MATVTDVVTSQQVAGLVGNMADSLEPTELPNETDGTLNSNGVDREDGDLIEGSAVQVPSNTPVTGDSGQCSPAMQSSTDSLTEELQPQSETPLTETPPPVSDPVTPTVDSDQKPTPNGPVSDNKTKLAKEVKREEKKKSKKKEDKSIDYILRALNSLQTPEEKLAALCKKYADLHEEHRVLQTSFKTQQRTMAVVMREKDQLQSEHTKAIMAKSKLESLCRELQKHNKVIKDESIKRAKEDDERRKEISAQFNQTIGEIQTQMTDNSERNAKLRQENENLAAQLRAFIKQCEVRDLQVEKLREQHELEKKLAEAKMNQAQAILKEHEEKSIKEKELMLLKLAESGKKTQILETQVNMYKERYDEFEKLHTRSSETFQKYKTEMDKMTKRIKKLEKDGVQWKTKWEGSNKALIEQIEARSKSEKDCLMYIQKTKKLESLCRALQAELHGKKVEPPPQDSSSAESQVQGEPSSDQAPADPSSDSSSQSPAGPGEQATVEPPAASTTTPVSTPDTSLSLPAPPPDTPASMDISSSNSDTAVSQGDSNTDSIQQSNQVLSDVAA